MYTERNMSLYNDGKPQCITDPTLEISQGIRYDLVCSSQYKATDLQLDLFRKLRLI